MTTLAAVTGRDRKAAHPEANRILHRPETPHAPNPGLSLRLPSAGAGVAAASPPAKVASGTRAKADKGFCLGVSRHHISSSMEDTEIDTQREREEKRKATVSFQVYWATPNAL
ncbi:hypothetical protein CORC01_06570 [Colletotrichum orchidophilum]|uniref:Uncharacterized protein n=1 Tax=Colletotrichum orchidophilum TaxID=1209926 RepID=A0A1G4BA96_9PEZI|nr:uncharacterized protein CORC01_06570 [Colletotrichum orchidophilum]OHE98202.1 hypothetical protein CORC01_06570 [Colletotrichum orchidophilum]